jgi:hypothetical protein
VLTPKEIGGAVAFDASEVTARLCVPPDPRNAELVFRSEIRAAIKRAVGAEPVMLALWYCPIDDAAFGNPSAPLGLGTFLR